MVIGSSGLDTQKYMIAHCICRSGKVVTNMYVHYILKTILDVTTIPINCQLHYSYQKQLCVARDVIVTKTMYAMTTSPDLQQLLGAIYSLSQSRNCQFHLCHIKLFLHTKSEFQLF